MTTASKPTSESRSWKPSISRAIRASLSITRRSWWTRRSSTRSTRSFAWRRSPVRKWPTCSTGIRSAVRSSWRWTPTSARWILLRRTASPAPSRKSLSPWASWAWRRWTPCTTIRRIRWTSCGRKTRYRPWRRSSAPARCWWTKATWTTSSARRRRSNHRWTRINADRTRLRGRSVGPVQPNQCTRQFLFCVICVHLWLAEGEHRLNFEGLQAVSYRCCTNGHGAPYRAPPSLLGAHRQQPSSPRWSWTKTTLGHRGCQHGIQAAQVYLAREYGWRENVYHGKAHFGVGAGIPLDWFWRARMVAAVERGGSRTGGRSAQGDGSVGTIASKMG